MTHTIEIYNSAFGDLIVSEQTTEFQALVERVRAGETTIDTSENCPCCGRPIELVRYHMTDDAKAALQELESICQGMWERGEL